MSENEQENGIAMKEQLHALMRQKNTGLLNRVIASGKTEQTASGKHKWFWVAAQDTSNVRSPRPYSKD